MRFIYEMPVYCGAMKVWRILNLNTGTVYSMDYETLEACKKEIKVGEVRGGAVVKMVDVHDVARVLHYIDSIL